MTRIARNRLQTVSFPAGICDRQLNGVHTFSDNTGGKLQSASCADFSGRPIGVNSLTINRYDKRGYTPCNGEYASGTDYAHVVDYIPDLVQSQFAGIITVGGFPSTTQALTTLRARTNPNRSEVCPLSLAQDLIDLPKMYKDWAGLLTGSHVTGSVTRRLSDSNLAIQFGWIPLYRDIKALCGLSSSISKRLKEIHTLRRSASGRRCSTQIAEISLTSDGTVASAAGFPLQLSNKQAIFSRAKMWAVGRWLIDADIPEFHDPARERQLITKILEDKTISGTIEGAWDLLPWSFMVDYFSNVGDFIVANKDDIPVKFSKGCVMTQTETTYELRPLSKASWVSGGEGVVHAVRKARATGSITDIPASEPIMGPKRLSILSSLAIQQLVSRDAGRAKWRHD